MLTTMRRAKKISPQTRDASTICDTNGESFLASCDQKTKEFYTVHELAERFGLKPVTVRRMAERGELPFYTLGRSMRFRHNDIETFLQSCKNPSHCD